MKELTLASWLLFVPPEDGYGGLFPIQEHETLRRCEDHAAWMRHKTGKTIDEIWCADEPQAG